MTLTRNNHCESGSLQQQWRVVTLSQTCHVICGHQYSLSRHLGSPVQHVPSSAFFHSALFITSSSLGRPAIVMSLRHTSFHQAGISVPCTLLPSVCSLPSSSHGCTISVVSLLFSRKLAMLLLFLQYVHFGSYPSLSVYTIHIHLNIFISFTS